MIDKKFLKTQLAKIETNYGKERFNVTQQRFDLWYEFFKEHDADGLRVSVDEYIRTNDYPPSVAGINNIYTKLSEYRKRIGSLITAKYKWMANWCEEPCNNETRQAYINYVYKFPVDKREMVIKDVAYSMIAYWNECDETGVTQRKTIKEFIEGLT